VVEATAFGLGKEDSVLKVAVKMLKCKPEQPGKAEIPQAPLGGMQCVFTACVCCSQAAISTFLDVSVISTGCWNHTAVIFVDMCGQRHRQRTVSSLSVSPPFVPSLSTHFSVLLHHLFPVPPSLLHAALLFVLQHQQTQMSRRLSCLS